MPFPYVGVCDVANPHQVRSLFLAFLKNRKFFSDRLFMAGLMMSYKTLHGLPTKWNAVFPEKEAIADIFSFRNPLLLNTLHYADYDGIDIPESLELATRFAGRNLDALQLDMVWPNPAFVKEYRENHPHIKIVLQTGGIALEKIGNSPLKFAECLRLYGNSVDYVLLDKSMGQGKGLDAGFLHPFIVAARQNFPELEVAVAGGLGPASMHLVEPLAKEFPGLSIDAQGRLRPSGSALDPLSLEMSKTYLERALRLFP